MATTERRVVLRVKLAKEFYFQGDQVSGEVLLEVKAPISGVGRLELKAWAEEQCRWIEIANTGGKKRETVAKWHGGKHIYRSIVTLYDIPNGNLAPGKTGAYLVPFSFYLPFKVAATTSFRAQQIRSSVRHNLQARLLSLAEIDAFPEGKPFIPKTSKIDAFDILDHPDREGHHIASTVHEIVVLEKPTYQGTLKPYSWQCTYTIPHAILGSGDLVMTIKKRFEPCAPGSEIPLWIECQNQSQSVITDVVVTLRHTISTRSHAGTFKQICYTHTQWRKPTSIWGSKKSSHSTPLSIPLRLPEGLASTSHGSSVTSDWEVNVSCRYRGRWSMIHYTTDNDITFPLTIWPDGYSMRQEDTPRGQGEAVRESGEVKENSHFEEALDIQESLVNTETPLTEWPPVCFDLSPEGGKPSTSDIVRLRRCKAAQAAVTAVESHQRPELYCRQDLGLTMSLGLENMLNFQQQKPVKPRHRSRNHIETRVRRTVAPLRRY